MSESAQNSGLVSQGNFVEAPYQDSSWEIVGEGAPSTEFLPMELEAQPSSSGVLDPMFADYGGISDNPAAKRWHLPEHLSDQVESQRRVAEQEEKGERYMPEQLEELKRQAYEQGKAEALKLAQEQQAEQSKQIESRLMAVFQDIATQAKQQLALIEQEAVELSLSISKKIIGYAVEINPEYVVKIVNEALSKAGGAAIRKVRVSPQDYEFIEVIGIAKQIKDFDNSWQFEKDETVRSGCIVSTSAGEVDFQLDLAWDRIRDAVLKSKV